MINIITHPGYRHADETLALALICGKHANNDISITFRAPTETELNDPNTWVIDIGGKYEPNLKNFDHHQDLQLPCSFHMITKYFDLTDILAVNSWFTLRDEWDRFGPKFVSQKYIDGKDSSVFLSPFEEWFLDELKIKENDTITTFGIYRDFRISMLTNLGQSLIERSRKIKDNVEWIKKNAIFKNFPNSEEQVCIIPKRDLIAKDLFLKYVDTEKTIALCHYDERGNGWAMYRLNDTPKINFNKVKGMEGIGFVHLSGFTGRTLELCSIDKLMTYLEISKEK